MDFGFIFQKNDPELIKISKNMLKSPKIDNMKVKLANKGMKQIWNSMAVNVWSPSKHQGSNVLTYDTKLFT